MAKINTRFNSPRFILCIFPYPWDHRSHQLALVAIWLVVFEKLLTPDADLFAFRSFFQHTQTAEVAA